MAIPDDPDTKAVAPTESIDPTSIDSSSCSQTLLPPAEFSKLIYSELTIRRIPIKFKQIHTESLKNLVKECSDTADELFKQSFVDANVLYRISNGTQEYSGADKDTFMEVFLSSKRLNFLSIGVAAKFDKIKGRYLRFLNVSAASTDSFGSEISVSGDDEMWGKSTKARFAMTVTELENANRFLYSTAFEFFLQMAAVVIVFAASVTSTAFISSKSYPLSKVYVFAAAFLVGSNIWTFLSRSLYSWRNKYFPVVSLKGRRAEAILLTLLGSLLVVILTWSITTSLDFIKGEFTNRIPPSAASPEAPH